MVIRQLEQADTVKIESITKINTTNSTPKTEKILLGICDYVELKPIISVKEIAENFQITYNTAAKMIDMLVDLKILRLKHEQSRYKGFYYEKYIMIFCIN